MAETKTLIEKLAAVMAAVELVPKRGHNDFHHYDYATEADIVAAVRKEMAAQGVMLIPSLVGMSQEHGLTTIKVKMTFFDEAGHTLEAEWAGVGQDKGDKGLYKAMTGATKYFLLKTFLIPTGDDPEADTATDRAAEREQVLADVHEKVERFQGDHGMTSVAEMARDVDPEPPDGAVVLTSCQPSPTNDRAYNVEDSNGTRYNLWNDGPMQDVTDAIAQERPVHLDLVKGKPKKTGGFWPATIRGVA